MVKVMKLGDFIHFVVLNLILDCFFLLKSFSILIFATLIVFFSKRHSAGHNISTTTLSKFMKFSGVIQINKIYFLSEINFFITFLNLSFEVA